MSMVYNKAIYQANDSLRVQQAILLTQENNNDGLLYVLHRNRLELSSNR